jgi:hypothetical protein
MDRKQEEMTRLSLFGLAPLAIGAAGVWLSPFPVPSGVAFDLGEIALIYAGVSAAYRAGVGAGGILRAQTNEGFLAGMIAAAVAWFAIWPVGVFYQNVPDILRYLLLIAVFAYLLLRDLRAVALGQLPAWYGALRARTTSWTAILLGLIGVRHLI